jgi:hypothetical protein
MRAFSLLNTFVPAGAGAAGAGMALVWVAAATGLTGVAPGFEWEAQPARQATPNEMVMTDAIVFIVLIFERPLSAFGFKLQFCFTPGFTPSPGARKMIPLLNKSA